VQKLLPEWTDPTTHSCWRLIHMQHDDCVYYCTVCFCCCIPYTLEFRVCVAAVCSTTKAVLQLVPSHTCFFVASLCKQSEPGEGHRVNKCVALIFEWLVQG
jgi:hypothetical protein